MKRDIFLQSLLLLIIIFPLIPPEGIYTLIPVMYSLIYSYWCAASYLMTAAFFAICFFRFKNGMRKHITSLIMSVFFVFLVLALTVINNGNLRYAVFSYAPCLVMCLLIYTFRNKLNLLISVFLIVLEFWIYINLIAMILYPNGMYYVESNGTFYAWIFGYKSSFQYYILPALCFGWLNWKYQKQNLRFMILVAACIYETLFSHNAMLLGGSFIILMLILFDSKRFDNLLNIRNYSIGIIISNLLVLFFTTWITRTNLGQMLLDRLGKNSTLSYRASLIWPMTLTYIKKNPWIGYGVANPETRAGIYGLDAATHAHNQFLEIMYTGGLVLFVVFLFIYGNAFIKLLKNRNLESTRILSASLFVMFMMVTVEVFTRRIGGGVWAIIFLCEYCKEIDEAYHIGYKHKSYYSSDSD